MGAEEVRLRLLMCVGVLCWDLQWYVRVREHRTWGQGRSGGGASARVECVYEGVVGLSGECGEGLAQQRWHEVRDGAGT